MYRKLLLLFLAFLPTLSFSENYILLVAYNLVVDSRYRYQALIKYDYESLREGNIKSEVVTKGLRGVPPYLDIRSFQVSFFDSSGNLKRLYVDFYQGELTNVLSFTNSEAQRIFDITSFVWALSKGNSDGNIDLFYGGEVKALTLTNFANSYVWGSNWIKLRKISELTLIDRFFLNGVNLGKFTNVLVEGRLVDLRLIDITN